MSDDLRIKILGLIIEEQGKELNDPDSVYKFFKNDPSISEQDVKTIIAAMKAFCTVMTEFVCPIVMRLPS